ncbi:MAG: InlB B-repeat-containing protein [Oscillospiraceae bacterium]|nr:InlB B-repeat-containing protein [Oscillospiraceae bacterium]
MNRTCLKYMGLLLAVIMILSMLPLGSLSALAEEPEPPEPDTPDTEIAAAALSLTLPQAGPTGAEAGQPVPASVSVTAGEGFSVKEAYWYNTSGIAPESFEAGQAYFAAIVLAPAEGFVFPESCSVSIDSLAVQSVALQSDGSLMVTTENYTIPGETVEWYNVWVSGVQVNSRNKDDILGDGGKASYDPSTGTLRLNDPAITAMHEPSGALILADGVNLTIEGSAALGETTADTFIFVNDGNLTLKGDFSATVTGNGIVCNQSLTAQEGKITVETTGADKSGIWVEGDMLVNTAEVTATGTAIGIYTKGTFTLEEGVIKAVATGEECDAEAAKTGLMSAEPMLIKGGDITAEGMNDGIRGLKGITVNGGIIVAKGGEIGIHVEPEGTLDLQNDTIRVTADGQGEHGAIYAPEILLGDRLGVKEPVGGKVGSDKRHITLKDGHLISKHALIENGYITYTVSFETFGGPEVESQTVPMGGTAEKPEDPVLEGYAFEGWYLDIAGGSGPYDFSTPVREDITLQARWTCPILGMVTDTDGNIGVGGLVSFGDEEYQSQLSFNAWREGGPYWIGCKPSHGYSFDHWEDEAGNPLAETEPSFNFPSNEGPKTFVAVFRREGVIVTFDGNGGEPASQTLVTGVDGKLDLTELDNLTNSMIRVGYNMTGWARTPDGDPFGIGVEVFTEDTTVYAVWTIQVHTVTFKANGGTETASQTVKHNACAYEPDDPTRRGYVFDGWYTDQNLTRLFDFSTPITSDLVLYAKWAKVVKYTVVSGGGSIYGKTSGKDLPITIRRTPKDADCYKHFTGVKVDGGELKLGQDYTAHAGSNGGTVVTLTNEFLSQLNSGTHIITITFDDGKAVTGLTVKAGTGGGGTRRGDGSGGDNPDTGDLDPLFWGGLLVFSGLGLGAVTLTGRKLRRSSRS